MNQYPRAFDDRRKTPRPPRVPVPLDQRPENRREVGRAVNLRAVVAVVVVAGIVLMLGRAAGWW